MFSKVNDNSSGYNSTCVQNSNINDGRRGIEDGHSSTETLSAEERHTLKHTQRQEPQGEEQAYAHSINNSSSIMNAPTTSHLGRSSDSASHSPSNSMSKNNDSNLSMSSNTNTLIIHHSVPDEPWNNRWLSGYAPSTTKSLRERSLQPTGTESNAFVTRVNSKHTESFTSTSSYIGGDTLLTSSLLQSSPNLEASALIKNSLFGRTSPSLARSAKYSTSTEILDIPSAYLDQSEVLKHLINTDVKEPTPKGGLMTNGSNIVNHSFGGESSDQSASSSNSAINVIYPERGSVSGSSSHGSHHMSMLDREDPHLAALLHRYQNPSHYPYLQIDCGVELRDIGHDILSEKPHLSKSQPDLRRIGTLKEFVALNNEVINKRFAKAMKGGGTVPFAVKELIESLGTENGALKVEVDLCYSKVTKLQRFEFEMAKLEEQYHSLVKLSDRREQMERAARHKLNTELRRLVDINNDLKEQLEAVNSQALLKESSSSSDVSSDSVTLKKEMNQRDVFIAQLVSQNKELIAAKERQEMELTAQRQTLNEQRTHIDILDSALTNAQTNVVKLEEEVRKKQNLVEQAGQLKRLLLSMKVAADRREQSEKNLRQKLEMEIVQLRSNVKMDQSASEASELRREVREKDEKIMLLEAEVTKCEQRFVQESAMRQIAIEAASLPKDAKIAALEKNSHDSERRIAQAKSDNVRHLDEIHNMNKKITALETRNRNLEAHNAEREAMIGALLRRAEEKENLLLNSSSSSVAGATNNM